MNEQLIVKNFGPIKDATVDFKRVTVFIGPTGGGKSTLAKLAAIFREGSLLGESADINHVLLDYGIDNYRENEYLAKMSTKKGQFIQILEIESHNVSNSKIEEKQLTTLIQDMRSTFPNTDPLLFTENTIKEFIKLSTNKFYLKGKLGFSFFTHYIPSERLLVSILNASWPSLIASKINLSKFVLDFAREYLKAGAAIATLDIPFLGIQYEYILGRTYVNFDSNRSLPINETASGIQSITPLLVLLEHLSHNTEQAQSFIIEEPELNLYPTAQQGLLNWLVEKCTKGENDLTITTHSPYILSHLNLLLYAYQVAEKHPDRKEAVAAIVPEASWINPKEFACYQVENGGVQSLVDEELGLIDNNELDGLSGDAADAFDNLIRLSKGFAIK